MKHLSTSLCCPCPAAASSAWCMGDGWTSSGLSTLQMGQGGLRTCSIWSGWKHGDILLMALPAAPGEHSSRMLGAVGWQQSLCTQGLVCEQPSWSGHCSSCSTKGMVWLPGLTLIISMAKPSSWANGWRGRLSHFGSVVNTYYKVVFFSQILRWMLYVKC